jgi:GT2 family glycosyltransferase
MSGSWEYPKPNVLVVILSGREVVTTAWAKGYKYLMYPERSNDTFLYGMPFDHARSQGCQRTLETGHEYLFFLDDDVIPPPDAIHRLIARNKDIVGGLYYRRQMPVYPVMMREIEGKGAQWITDARMGDLVEADLVGCGCLLIKRKVLEIMPPPWFEWKCDPYRWPNLQPHERCSEDYDFCRKARALGFKLFVDTTVQCVHAGLGAAMPGGAFGPLQLP